jgi:two-component system chemotaxis response regulator CheB
LIVAGTSWGGLKALGVFLGGLPSDLPAAVVVVQHRSPESHPTALRDLLQAKAALPVHEVADKQPLEPGCAYLAPPDYHTLVEDDHLALSIDFPVGFSRPSIDLLFETAAESRGERCVGVVLTGANADGASGLARIVEFGGAAVVEDPQTAERPEMPAAAVRAVPTAQVVPLPRLAETVAALCMEKRVAV